MNPSPQDIIKESHEQWLQNPVTQQALILLQNRHKKYVDDIQTSVLLETNQRKQEDLRANISCIQTTLKMLTDTETFVQLSTTK